MFIKNMTRKLQKYLQVCQECQFCSTKRHTPYGELHPIQESSVPRDVQTMDFVMKMPPTKDAYDALLTATCKATKAVLLIKGKENWGAEDWADRYVKKIVSHEWGLPRVQITDRDPRFVSSFWKRVCAEMGISQHMTTAYHPQADGQSERTNQTVEIAIRYFVTTNPDREWTSVLPYLQASLNNAINATTGFSPNQLLLRMDLHTASYHPMAHCLLTAGISVHNLSESV